VAFLLSSHPRLNQLEDAQDDPQADKPEGQFPNSNPARHFLEIVHSAVEGVATRILLGVCARGPQELISLRAVHHRYEVRTLLAGLKLVPSSRVTCGVIEDVASNVLHAQLSFISALLFGHARDECLV